MNNRLTEELYNDYYRPIELIRQNHTLLPSGILFQAIDLYTHLTGKGVCIQCSEEIQEMIITLRNEIKIYENEQRKRNI